MASAICGGARRGWLPPTGGRTARTRPHTRADLIEQQRRERTAHRKPEGSSKSGKRMRLLQARKIPERLSHGGNALRVRLSGVMPHGGFRLGPGSFCHDRLGGRLAPPTARQISTSGLQRGILPLRSQEPGFLELASCGNADPPAALAGARRGARRKGGRSESRPE